MAQLSRPYQIGLAAIVLLAAVWLLLLQGHSSSPAGSATTAAVPTVTSTARTSPAKSSSTAGVLSKHANAGSSTQPNAPGVAGLGRAITKAQGAVETSQKNAQQLEEKSAQASSATESSSATPSAATPTSTSTSASAAPAKAVTSTPAASKTAKAPAAAGRPATSPSSSATKAGSHSSTPTRERAVEAELAQGKVVLILFWDPKGADDVATHKAVRQLQSKAGLNIAINEAPAGQVSSFGTITSGIQVYGTPTLLILNKHGQTITLTGLQDSYDITQAIQEARHPS